MSFDNLLKHPYEIHNQIIKCLEKDINIYILEQKNDNVILHLTLTDARKLFEMNPELAQQFNTITNDAFQKEISFKSDSTTKRITEYELNKDFNEIGRVDSMVFVYNLKENDIVASLFYGDKEMTIAMSVYVYAVFSNPKYRRQGHCEKMITLIKNEKSKIYGIFIMISSIFAWNVASLGLYKKMGFYIVGVDLDDNIDKHMTDKGIKELQYACHYEGQKITEGHYFTLVQHICSPEGMQRLIEKEMQQKIEIKDNHNS